MDEPKQITTIDDLVNDLKEGFTETRLTRPMASSFGLPVSATPPPVSSPSPVPAGPMEQRPAPPIDYFPLSAPTAQPESSGASKITASSAPLTGGSAKGFRSSIRTMNSDILLVRKGQSLSGIDFQKNIAAPQARAISREEKPEKSEAPSPMTPPVPPKPFVLPPLPQKKISNIQPPIYISGERTQQAQQPKKNLPEERGMPFIPSSFQTEKPHALEEFLGKEEKEEEISVSLTQKLGSLITFHRNMLFLILAMVLAVGAFSSWYLFIGMPTPAPEEVKTTPTLTPVYSQPAQTIPATFFNLNGIFSDQSGVITVQTNDDLKRYITAGIFNNPVTKGQFKRINIQQAGQGYVNLPRIFDAFAVDYPRELKDVFSQESAVLLYGQKEVFSPEGQAEVAGDNVKKLVFINEISDATKAGEALKGWEQGITEDLDPVFDIREADQATQNFLSNSYESVPLKYKNFPFPDNSLDYFLIIGGNDKTYLIITTSREATFRAIDTMISSFR